MIEEFGSLCLKVSSRRDAIGDEYEGREAGDSTPSFWKIDNIVMVLD
jgi:hypothetical protein